MKRRLAALVATGLLLAGCSTGTSDITSSSASSTTSPNSPGLSDCKKDGQGFTGGATVPRQIFGSYGPGKSVAWDVETGKAGGNAQNVQMATGMPNGIVTILWGKDAQAGDGTFTVECTVGWDVYEKDDLTKLWQSGIIFDEISGLGTNTFFCHHIEMDTSGDTVTMNMWETFWAYGEDYTCPETLKNALDSKTPFKNPITFLSLSDTGTGAAVVPESDWTADGTHVGVDLG